MRRIECNGFRIRATRLGAGRVLVLLAAVLFCDFAGPARAATTRATLILASETAQPGDTVMAGIRLQMQPRWHTYWVNAGDSGLPTKMDWILPGGVTAGDIQWPVPDKLVTPPLTTYVYHDEVILLIPLKIGTNVPDGLLDIKAKVTWQECSDEVCILGHGTIEAKLIIGAMSKPSEDAALIETAREKLPKNEATPPIKAHWEKDDDTRPMIVEWSPPEKSAVVDFYPYSSDKYEVKGETERLPDADGNIRIRKMVSKSGTDWPAQIRGVMVSKAAGDGAPQGYEVSLTPASISATTPDAGGPPAPDASLAVMLGSAFLGGLILNIMPCVLPVIALKVLGFVKQSHEKRGRARKLGLIYGLGVLVSFLVLAGVAIAVQRAGGLASWSSAFQNPQFRVIITILITLVALNLFGVFEVTLGGRTMGVAGDLTAKDGAAGAFFNGVLATVLATPCTAPILAGAISFAFTQPPAVIVLIFLAVGLGLAAPFVLLCWQPDWLKFLPKPGLWMQRFKVAMGFPMLATAFWLFWLTASRLGKSGVLWFGLFLVILALAAWIWGEFVQRGAKRAGLAMVISLALAVAGYGFILEKQLHWRSPLVAQKEDIDWQTWSSEAVAKARDKGHPVLVDFTADTCLNCQINKLTSIDIKRTRDKLKEINAATFIADFTDEDEAIARELKRFGRPGVPLVLVYPAKKDLPPIVLPPILTPGIVLGALDKAALQGAPAASASNH